MSKEEIKKYLLDKGVWIREINEILAAFENWDDIAIVGIFDSACDLGEYYVDNCVGELDYYIQNILDYEKLGNYIANEDDEYQILRTGRIIEYEI